MVARAGRPQLFTGSSSVVTAISTRPAGAILQDFDQSFAAETMEVLVEAVGAAEGGLLALVCTMPIETVQKTQIAQKSRGQGQTKFFELASRILKESGPFGFYRGVGVLSTMVANEKFIYYLLYTFVKKRIEAGKTGSLSLASNIAIGYLADLGRLPVTMPLDLLSTRMQTSTTGTLSDMIREVLQQHGFKGFYRGWRAYIALAVKPAIQILVFEQGKAALNRRRGRPVGSSLPFWEAFVLGALARLIATVICYPFFFARITAQSGQGAMCRGALVVMRELYRKGGVGALYHGIVPELARGVLFHAVNMASMETLRSANSRLLLSKQT